MVLGTAIIVSIITVLVLISFAVPILRGRPRPVQDIERPYGTTVSKKMYTVNFKAYHPKTLQHLTYVYGPI